MRPMLYELALRSDIEDREPFDDAQEVKRELDRLRQELPTNSYMILRNGQEITEVELENDIAISSTFESASKIPAGYRHGAFGGTDDLGIGPNHERNEPKVLWKPPNPEDDYQ